MDVVVLFGFGWKAATIVQRRAMLEQIQKMLNWCLAESLQPDGSFAHGGDDSAEENTYFGAAFLSRIGCLIGSGALGPNENSPKGGG